MESEDIANPHLATGDIGILSHRNCLRSVASLLTSLPTTGKDASLDLADRASILPSNAEDARILIKTKIQRVAYQISSHSIL